MVMVVLIQDHSCSLHAEKNTKEREYCCYHIHLACKNKDCKLDRDRVLTLLLSGRLGGGLSGLLGLLLLLSLLAEEIDVIVIVIVVGLQQRFASQMFETLESEQHVKRTKSDPFSSAPSQRYTEVWLPDAGSPHRYETSEPSASCTVGRKLKHAP